MRKTYLAILSVALFLFHPDFESHASTTHLGANEKSETAQQHYTSKNFAKVKKKYEKLIDKGLHDEARSYLLKQLSKKKMGALEKTLMHVKVIDLAIRYRNISEAMAHVLSAKQYIGRIPHKMSLSILFAEAQLRYIKGDMDKATFIFNSFVQSQQALGEKFLPIHYDFRKIIDLANAHEGSEAPPAFSYEDYSFKDKSPRYNMVIAKMPRMALYVPRGAKLVQCDITLSVLSSGRIHEETMEIKSWPENKKLERSCAKSAAAHRYKPYIKDGKPIRVDGVLLTLTGIRTR